MGDLDEDMAAFDLCRSTVDTDSKDVREDSRSLTFNDATYFEFLDFESLGFEIKDEAMPMG